MLVLDRVSVFVGESATPVLEEVSLSFPEGHFGAIVGGSGSGKTTLLKAIAGIAPGDEEGVISWRGRNLEEEDFLPSEIGYVPQFSIAHDELTVLESVVFAARLRTRRPSEAGFREDAEHLLEEVGLGEFGARRVGVLSGGQKRRLALAIELASRPDILLCDEVTSGLDAHSEDGIVKLLHRLSRQRRRLVLTVTHSLAHMDLYDSVTVLTGGVVAYHGPPAFAAHYFGVERPGDIYERLESRTPQEWAASWTKHQRAVAEAAERPSSEAGEDAETDRGDVEEPAEPPGFLVQSAVLLARRMVIFSRSKAELLLQAGLIFGFPVLVAVFAWNGLPAVTNLSMGLDLDVVQQLTEARDFLAQGSRVGSLVSGIVMFQVVLLTLMGANNAGREVAAERDLFEKEKLSGLDPLAYVVSKAAFLLLLVAAQSSWMGFFVREVCGFPGDAAMQFGFLFLVNAAMTALCLGISSWLRSPGQASIASIYLVGFQLPLSGAVLALPEWLGPLVRPFISAYWSWSGILQTLKNERTYDIVQMVVQSPLSPAPLCAWVLLLHIAAGLVAAWFGCERRRIG
jgi:ABC-type multidrug transport system ATPase subunit